MNLQSFDQLVEYRRLVAVVLTNDDRDQFEKAGYGPAVRGVMVDNARGPKSYVVEDTYDGPLIHHID